MNEASLTYVVQPFALPMVQDQHLPGLFCEFGEVVSAHIAQLRDKRHPHLERVADVFQHLLETVDHDAFRRLQVEFVSPRWLEDDLSAEYMFLIKYLDPIVWFTSKTNLAIRLGLRESAPLRILDIGTGAGHLPAIATHFGHKVTAADLPEVIARQTFSGTFFSAMCDVYGVGRVPLKVRAFEDLPRFDDRFDLATALMAAFNADENLKGWGISEWNHFLVGLKRHVLTETGRLYMALTFGKLTDDAWAHLEAMSCYSVAKAALIEIRDFSRAVSDSEEDMRP